MKSKLINMSLSCLGIILIWSLLLGVFIKRSDYDTNVENVPLKNQLISYNNYVENLSNPVVQYDIAIPDYFEKVADNNKLELFLEKRTLAIAIRVKENGYVWYSYDVNADLSNYSQEMLNRIKSGITIITYNKFTPGKRNVLNEGVNITYKTIENGFIATVDFTDVMIKFDLVVHLDGRSLFYEVPRNSVSEYNPKLWVAGNTDVSLNKLVLYPFFGSTIKKENGYIIIPDGTGAIVSLKDEPKYKLAYSQPVYGNDYGYDDNPVIQGDTSNVGNHELKRQTVKPLSRITMPLYGIIHDTGNNGILVVSESGASYAEYNYMAKSLITDFYQSYFDYIYRDTYKQYLSRTDTTMHILGFQPEPNEFDIKQRVVFLTEDDADYVGAAKTYRKLLEEHSGFSQDYKISNSYTTKIDIIGNEIEQGLFKTKNVTASTYQDTTRLIKKLQKDGYESLDVTFKTFNPETSSYRFNVFKNLGGEDHLNDMLSYFKNNNQVDFNYLVDYTKTYKQKKETASRMSRSVLSTYNDYYLYDIFYMNNPKYIKNLIDSDFKKYQTYNIKSLALIGLDQALFTQNDKGVIRYRNDSVEYVKDGMELLNNHDIQMNFYNPDAYLYPYVSKYYDTPYTSSEQMFIDASIPLLQLVVSGHMELYSPYLNFITNEKSNLLRLLEYGINPSYVMTTEDVYKLKYSNSSNIFVSQYEYLKERMKIYDAFLIEGLNEINGKELVDHTFLAEGVSLSKFSNGTTIITNYTNDDYDYNGTIIEAKGYDVL